ncbi:sulfurtransferase [Mesorhizobium sp. CAU 1732]|uniref:sulfurtransferase n=1 Tax=Mesorhizobium sp. CAU 1732 TaxID=3140358 RepID=UPI003260CAE5
MTQLIEAADLRAAPKNYRIVAIHFDADTEDSRAAFAAEHIPGAVLADRLIFSRAPEKGEGRNPLPRREQLEKDVRTLGLLLGDRIVLYDAKKNVFASRAWWVLRNAGFTDVRILNGGLKAWKAAGGEIASGDVTVRPSSVEISDDRLPAISGDDAAVFPQRGILLDARSAARFSGQPDPLDPRPGHVPGAVNIPWEGLIDDQDRFLPASELRERFASLGIKPDTAVAAYCGSGVSAAHVLVSLEVAGFPTGALYPGSWSEWAADPRRPVEA